MKTTLNEVNLFKKLNHPNIVNCFYSFEEISHYSGNKYLVLVLEYVNGGDLHNWIQVSAYLNPYLNKISLQGECLCQTLSDS